MTDVYTQALCLFIQDGLLTLEQVQEQVRVVESIQLQQSRQTPFWDASRALCERLNAGIAANSHKPFKMNVTNISSMEKLLRIDKVSIADAEKMIDWCVGHEFWGTVIFSPLKFRKHYPTMLLRQEREGGRSAIIERTVTSEKPAVDFDLIARQRQAEAVPMPKDFKKVLRFQR